MARRTKLGRLLGRVSEEQHVIGAVMAVAACARELSVLCLRVDPVLERMARLGDTGYDMEFLRDLRVAFEAEIIYRCVQHRRPAGRMRLMTYNAQTCRDNRMDVLVGKERHVVTFVAEIRNLRAKQPLEIRLMGLMAVHAHPSGNRRMLELKPHDLVFTVASEADARDLVTEQLFSLACMGVMAQYALAVVDWAVDPVLPGKERFVVAHEAEIRRRREQQFVRLAAVRIMT